MKVKDFIKDEKVYLPKELIENPVVSILLPTYCRGDNGLLERSIESIINQTFKEWELIIIDDGSIDSTSEIVRRFLNKDNRIIYIRNDNNSGLPAIRENQGMLHSRGKYIAYQFDDDIWYENMLEIMVNKLNSLGDLGFVYAKGKFVNSITKSNRIHGQEYDKEKMGISNLILNNTVVHSRKLPYLYGSYDCHVTMRRLCDWDLWRRWANYIDLTFVDEVVSQVEHSHSASIGLNANMNKFIVEERQKIDRCKILSLNNIDEYEVDDIDIIKDVSVQKVILDNDILPWRKQKGLE